MLCFKTLENRHLLTIYTTFKDAFSDYLVPMKPEFSQFKNILLRRGYDSALSVGAFDDGELVGFIFSSCRIWNGKKTLYTIGVGVIPTYRGQKIAEKLYQELFIIGSEIRVEQYLLEVITHNIPAIKLYEKLGFKRARKLRCFDLNKPLPVLASEITSALMAHYDISIEPKNPKTRLEPFSDYPSSWQYSYDSINADPQGFYYVIARINQEIAGIIIADQETGAIYQIAIAQDHRQQQLATAMLTILKAKMPDKNLSLYNIDDRNHSLIKFIEALEFEHLIDQYEMLKVV